MKWKRPIIKKPLGGALAAPLIGSGINILSSIIQEAMQKDEQFPMKQNVNPFALEKGGYIQYNAPSHAKGGMKIDVNGNPNPKGNIEVELNETSYRPKINAPGGYVYSDKLFLENGKTIAENHANAMKKMKGSDQISRRGKQLYSKYLQRVNDKLREGEETTEGKAEFGLPFGPISALQTIRDNNPDWLASHTNTPEVDLNDPFGVANLTAPGGEEESPSTFTYNPEPLEKSITGFNPPLDNLPGTPAQKAQKEQLTSTFDQGSAAKIGSLIGSTILSTLPAEKEKLQLPDYSAGDKLASTAKLSATPLINQNIRAAESARAAAGEGVRNFGQYFNRLGSIQGKLADSTAKAEFDVQQANVRTDLLKARREDRKAEGDSRERIRTQIADSQNKAMSQDLVQNLLNKVDAYGTEFQRQDFLREATQDMNEANRKKFMLDVLNMKMKYPNFTLSDEAADILKNPDNYSEDQLISIITKR